jgi:hypothetical protein
VCPTAGALAATQPEAAAMIQGAAGAYVAESPTPSLRPRKPSTISNPGLNHEQVAPEDMPGAAIRLDAELMSNRSSAPIGLSLAALDRRLRQMSADSSSTVDSSLDPSSMDASQA